MRKFGILALTIATLGISAAAFAKNFQEEILCPQASLMSETSALFNEASPVKVNGKNTKVWIADYDGYVSSNGKDWMMGAAVKATNEDTAIALAIKKGSKVTFNVNKIAEVDDSGMFGVCYYGPGKGVFAFTFTDGAAKGRKFVPQDLGE